MNIENHQNNFAGGVHFPSIGCCVTTVAYRKWSTDFSYFDSNKGPILRPNFSVVDLSSAIL